MTQPGYEVLADRYAEMFPGPYPDIDITGDRAMSCIRGHGAWPGSAYARLTDTSERGQRCPL